MIILKNGKVYTMNEEQPWADTLVIDEGKISYVGSPLSDLEITQQFSTAHIVDLHGKMTVPGLIDSHVHPGAVSQSSWHISLPKTDDLDEILEFVKDYADKHPKEEVPFLYFEYYPTYLFGTEGPKKEILDEIVNDRPCLLQDSGDHLHWINSCMLELMEVDKYTPDPIPGLQIFVRDSNGNPTGLVKEMAWMAFEDKLYSKIGWQPPTDFTAQSLTEFFSLMTSNGITGLVDALIENETQIKAIREMDDKKQLNMFYDGAVRFNSLEELPERIDVLKRYQKKYSNDHIRVQTMKLFLDGTNESGNSAVLKPLINDSTNENYGEIAMEEDELRNCILMCDDNNLDIHLHVVGDRAFRVACNAYKEAKLQNNGKLDTQMIIAHCELVDPKDMTRPAELGITINWSCHWSGGYFGEEAKEYLGDERWNRMYQFNPMIDSGALITFSSDVITRYELERADPFFGMQVAVTRHDKDSGMDYRPPISAKLDREILLKGYTINGAKQMKLDDIVGSLEVGKLANIAVLSDNFFEVSEDKIKDIKVETVLFEGKAVYGKL